MIRVRHCLLLLVLIPATLLLAACTAPAPAPDAPSAASPPATGTPAPVVASPAPPPPAAAAPPANAAPAADKPAAGAPQDPVRTCRTDADCAVKNVGSCCGYYPLCVNKDAKTDPEAVRAQCEKDGMASICGFQEIQGCQCVQGRCENIAAGGPVAM
jgi:hypothetical protein